MRVIVTFIVTLAPTHASTQQRPQSSPHYPVLIHSTETRHCIGGRATAYLSVKSLKRAMIEAAARLIHHNGEQLEGFAALDNEKFRAISNNTRGLGNWSAREDPQRLSYEECSL